MALADNIITRLAQHKTRDGASQLLSTCSLRTLRAVADLMGIDSTGMTRREAITEILATEEIWGSEVTNSILGSNKRWADTQTNAGLTDHVPYYL
jgi:hypothetical protein